MRVPLTCAVLLAACDAQPPAPAPPKVGTPVVATIPAKPSAPAIPPPRYVGRWAAAPDMCATGWWRFWKDEILTGEGEMRCDILPPDAKSGDERLRTVCQAEGKVSREEWVITYPAENTMVVKRDDGTPVTLAKC